MDNIILQDKEYLAYQFEGYIFNKPNAKKPLSPKLMFNKTVLYALDWIKLRLGDLKNDNDEVLPELIKLQEPNENVQMLITPPSTDEYETFDIEPYNDCKVTDVFNIKLLGLKLDENKRNTADVDNMTYQSWSLRIKEKDNLRDFNGQAAPKEAQNRIFVTDIAVSYNIKDDTKPVYLSIRTTVREPISNTLLCNSVRTEFIDKIVDDKALALYSYKEPLPFMRVNRVTGDEHSLERNDIESFANFIRDNEDIGTLPFLIYHKHGTPDNWKGLFHMMSKKKNQKDSDNFIRNVANSLFGYVHFIYINDTGSKNRKFNAMYGETGLNMPDVKETDTILLDPFASHNKRFKLLYISDMEDDRLYEQSLDTVDYFSPDSNIIFSREEVPKTITDHQAKLFFDALKRVSFNKGYRYRYTTFYNELKIEKWRTFDTDNSEESAKTLMSMQGTIDGLQDQISRLKAGNVELSEAKENLTNENNRLARANDSLQKKLNHALTSVEQSSIDKDSKISELNDQLAHLEQEIERAKAGNFKIMQEAIATISSRFLLDPEDIIVENADKRDYIIPTAEQRYHDYLIFTDQVARGYTKELKDKNIDSDLLKILALIYVYARVKYDDSLLIHASSEEREETADALIAFYESLFGFTAEPVGLDVGKRNDLDYKAHIASYIDNTGANVERYMDYHLKRSQNSTETFRVHYLYDDALKKIVIGAAREHLKMQANDGNPGGRL